MTSMLRHILVALALIFATDMATAQSVRVREMHKVKRKETVYSIAHKYEITVDELVAANPEMNGEDFTLKKGDYVRIPFSRQDSANALMQGDATREDNGRATTKTDVRQRTVKVGVMLPLEGGSDDSRRMTEYYRGILMACDSLRREGVSVDVWAWNTNKDTDVGALLSTPKAAALDVIFGPLYGGQVAAMAAFARDNDIKLFVPFSVDATAEATNDATYLAALSDTVYYGLVAAQFVRQFKDNNVVIVDCGDEGDKRAAQMARELRSNLNLHEMRYATVGVNASEGVLAAAFKKDMDNVVVLNTTSSQNLNIALANINKLSIMHPEMRITLFGQTEWMMYTHLYLANFYRYNTFIPSTFFMNALSTRTAEIVSDYLRLFHEDMANTLPRLAISGFDHAYFFIKGLKSVGNTFDGHSGEVGYAPIQSPLNFVKSDSGVNVNNSIMFVNYTPANNIEIYPY